MNGDCHEVIDMLAERQDQTKQGTATLNNMFLISSCVI